MKNRTPLRKLNQATSETESVKRQATAKIGRAASGTESKTAIFRPALIQILNTYIYLAMVSRFSGALRTIGKNTEKTTGADLALWTLEAYMGKPRSTVNNCIGRNRVPMEYWVQLVDAATSRDIPLTYGHLAKGVAKGVVH